MDWKLGGLIVVALAGCQAQTPAAAPVAAAPASYEDCLFAELGDRQTVLATETIIDACRTKFPEKIATQTPRPQVPLGSMFDELPDLQPGQAQKNVPVRRPPASTSGMFDDIPVKAATNQNPYLVLLPKRETFHGDACTEDCSGHEAGYQWAEDNGIEDPDDCGGNSESFRQGCIAWAAENG